MKYYRIVTSCNFVGCDTTHIVALEDDESEDDYGAELASEDICPDASIEEISKEEAEEEGIEN